MLPVDDCIFPYTGYHGTPSRCRLRIYFNNGLNPTQAVVLLTELIENKTGTSITNMIETLATLISFKYELDPCRTQWIEHYPARYPAGWKGHHPVFDEKFHLVSFAWGERFSLPNKEAVAHIKIRACHPTWIQISSADVENMIGKTITSESQS